RSFRDLANLVDQPLPQRERRNEQLAEPRRPPEAGGVVEEVGDVRRHVLVGGEETEVLVVALVDVVVVARTEMHVAPQAAALAPDDARRLRGDLPRREAVD